MRIILPTLLSLLLFATSADALQLCAKADLKGPDPTKPRNNSPIKLRETCKPIKEVSIGTTDKLLAADTQPLVKDANGQTVGHPYLDQGSNDGGSVLLKHPAVNVCITDFDKNYIWGWQARIYFTTQTCAGAGYSRTNDISSDLSFINTCEVTTPLGAVAWGDSGPEVQEAWGPLEVPPIENLQTQSVLTDAIVEGVGRGVCQTSSEVLDSAAPMMRIGTFTPPYHVE